METEDHTQSFMEKMRDARMSTLRHRAAGRDVQYTPDPELYAMFPELEAVEVDAESSFLALQNAGNSHTPLV